VLTAAATHVNQWNAALAFFPGFAYQIGIAFAASIICVESMLGEHFTCAQAMGGLAATVMIGVVVVTFLGPENHRVAFRKTA